jgi:hypothetical protein
MVLGANAVRPLGFRLPETSLQISRIISLLEWKTAPLQGFLLQRITEKKCRHTHPSPVEFESKIPVREVEGRKRLVSRGHRN